MSDPENDREFLEEIKALEDALAIEQRLAEPPGSHESAPEDAKPSRASLPRRANAVSASRGFGQVEPILDEEDQEDGTKTSPAEGLSAYETNVRLIELLRETKRELTSILERCRENRATIEEKIQARARAKNVDYLPVCAAATPYFKDVNGYSAPENNDAKKKRRNGEFGVGVLPTPMPWTPRDRNILWRAIRQEAADAFLESGRPGDDNSARSDDDDRRENSGVESSLLPKDFKELVGARATREFDWLKIATKSFEDRHSADECRVMWRVFLHPDVNRYRWSKDEDSRLVRLAESHGLQNWEEIAVELGTRRSGYQCFVRYNSTERAIRGDEGLWTPNEDRRLALCVEKFKIGDYVPWGIVARYMPGRIKTQVYYRWIYHSTPRLKKGRFTRDEDRCLLEAVQRYGENFTRISSTLIPNRSSVQLGNRYRTLEMRKRGTRNVWSISEDARLLVLYNEYGADWSSIAGAISGKTRTQVRHRHKAITRYWAKGISVYEIPRVRDSDCPRDVRESEERRVAAAKTVRARSDREAIARAERDNLKRKKRDEEANEMERIDCELMDYFWRTPISIAATAGRKRKYYGSEELEEMSRKLRLLLKTLDAELEIPTELDYPGLTEKDKQLLESLRKWHEPQPRRADLPSAGPRCPHDNPRSAEEKHFACSGNCCDKREKFRTHENIEYRPPSNLDHCRVALNIGIFVTSDEIIKLIGEDTNAEFERISRLVTSRYRTSRVDERVYVLGPEMSTKIMSKIVPRLSVSAVDGVSPTTDGGRSAVEMKKHSPKMKDQVWNANARNGIIQCMDQSLNCIEPNYHTLLALHRIISDKPKTIFEVDQQQRVSSPMSHAAKTSMKKLQKRLVQLFKYPIGLAHIFRPDVDVATNLQCFEPTDPDVVAASSSEVVASTSDRKIRS